MRRIGLPMLVFFLCFVSTGRRQAQAQTKPRVITFDVPAAGPNQGQGTLPAQVTDSGLTVGSYVDVNGVSHGFVRALDGTITTFDAPGAGMGAGEGTVPEGITDAGIVVGAVFDGSHVFHAFFGSPGHFTTFDAPGAGTQPLPRHQCHIHQFGRYHVWRLRRLGRGPPRLRALSGRHDH